MLLSVRTFQIMMSRSRRQSECYQLFFYLHVSNMNKSFACTLCVCRRHRAEDTSTWNSEIEGQIKMFTIYSIVLQRESQLLLMPSSETSQPLRVSISRIIVSSSSSNGSILWLFFRAIGQSSSDLALLWDTHWQYCYGGLQKVCLSIFVN